VDQRPLDGNDPQQRHRAEDEREVVGVRADDVADADLAEPRKRRVDRHDELGRRGPHRDDRQSDRELADAEPPRHSNGRVDERASADPQPEDGDDDDPDLNDRRSRGHTITLLGRRQ